MRPLRPATERTGKGRRERLGGSSMHFFRVLLSSAVALDGITLGMNRNWARGKCLKSSIRATGLYLSKPHCSVVVQFNFFHCAPLEV